MQLTLKSMAPEQLWSLWGTKGTGRDRRIAAELIRRGLAKRCDKARATHTIDRAGCYNYWYIREVPNA